MTNCNQTPLCIGSVTLNVRDVGRVTEFYHAALGLEVLAADSHSAALGVGSRALLDLRGDGTWPRRSPRAAGLFHTAFRVPGRADLGRWIVHARRSGLVLDGAADHLVSEAVYLSDPEGNGIEIYADRPPETWDYDEHGQVLLANRRLDFDGLRDAARVDSWQGAPAGTIIGHVHLQVGAIEPAERFYADLLGFDVSCRYPGASFFASGGYHHHLAVNTWNSQGALEQVEPATGLAEVGILAADKSLIESLRKRFAGGEPATCSAAAGWSVRDPWGTRLSFTVKQVDSCGAQGNQPGYGS